MKMHLPLRKKSEMKVQHLYTNVDLVEYLLKKVVLSIQLNAQLNKTHKVQLHLQLQFQ